MNSEITGIHRPRVVESTDAFADGNKREVAPMLYDRNNNRGGGGRRMDDRGGSGGRRIGEGGGPFGGGNDDIDYVSDGH